jgi:hypothetical protein
MKKLFAGALIVLFAMTFANKGRAQVVSTSTKSEMEDTTGYKKFKEDADKKIKENEKRIAELKKEKREGTQEVKDKYNKKVADLEQRNMELKKRMNDYTYDNNNSKWNQFKREFNHDMKELGHALKDIGKDNVK